MSDDSPEGVNSAMLASMELSGSHGSAGAGLAANGGTGTATTIGAENPMDTLGKNSISLGEASSFDLSGITGGGALEGNILDGAEGNMAIGSINHNAWDANNIGMGDVSANKAFSPGKETLNMPSSISAHSALRGQGG